MEAVESGVADAVTLATTWLANGGDHTGSPDRRNRARGAPAGYGESCGADEGARTPDLLFTRQLLCQLSYVGVATAGDRVPW